MKNAKTMNYSKICILVFACILLAACKGRYTTNDTILRAEALLNSKPDSAQQLLLSIPHPEKLSKADYAAWCLQYTHAQYKLDIDIKSDSMIRFAIQYYNKSNLAKQNGTAYYLWGCILQLQQKNKEAMWTYKKAVDLLKTTNENNLKGLVEFKIGYLYMLDELYVQSLIHYKGALKYFSLSKNTKYLAYAYNEISNMCFQLNLPFNKVLYYSNLALKQAKLAGDSDNYYLILARQGEFLYRRDCIRSTKLLLQGFRFLPVRRAEYAAFLALNYSILNKLDSANYYLKISQANTTSANNNLRFLGEAYVSRGERKYDRAFQRLEKAYSSRDSIYKKDLINQLYRIDKQYDLNKKEQENARLKISNQRKIILIALLVIAILVLSLIISLVKNKHRKKLADIEVSNQIKQQSIEYDLKLKQAENMQKQSLLLMKLQNKIDNTLAYNRLSMNYTYADKRDEFEKIMIEQAVLSEKDWQYYIDEVDHIFDKKLSAFQSAYPDLSQLDLIVVTLICLQIGISDICCLLNMHKTTLYKRRSRMKDRIGLSGETDLEEWIQQTVGHKFVKENL
jgi:hypothetical protein